MIEPGQLLPEGTLTRLTGDGVVEVPTRPFFANRRIVLFAVPGAFTPTCSARHLPGFVDRAAEIRAKGIDEIVCLSVNDAFVMDAWGKSVGDGVTLLADADGSFAGVLLGTIKVDWFVRYYGDFKIDERGALVLAKRDGTGMPGPKQLARQFKRWKKLLTASATTQQ